MYVGGKILQLILERRGVSMCVASIELAHNGQCNFKFGEDFDQASN